MTQTLETFLVAAVDTLIVFLILLLAKKLRDVRFRASFDIPSGADPAEFTADHQIEEKGNVAVALRRCGLSVAFGFGLAGVVSGGMQGFASGIKGFLQDTGLIVLDCVILLVFLFFAQFVVEKIILRHINNNAALKDNNTAVGFTEFGSYAATGLIAYGSFSGEGGGWQTAVGFFLLGQVALLLFAVVYEWSTPFNMIEQIQKGNAAAGVMLGGTLLTLGIILSWTIAGPFVGWTEGIIGFARSTAMGVILLIPFQFLIDKAFLPHTTLKIEVERDQNVATCAVTVCSQVALAIMIGALVA